MGSRVLIVIAVAILCLGRVGWGHREPSASGTFEAFAHLFVGALLGAFAESGTLYSESWLGVRWRWRYTDQFLLSAALAPSLFELVAFFVTR